MVLAVVPPVWGTLKRPLVECAVQLDAAVATRFPRTRERLHVIAAAAAAESTQASDGTLSIASFPLGLGRVLSQGLLERTEAVLDSLLPHGCCLLPVSDGKVQGSKQAHDEDDDDEEDLQSERSLERGERVPRSLPFLQTFAVNLYSGTHTLRVTVLCVQDTYSSVVSRLGVDRLWQLIRSLEANEVKQELVDAARDPPAAAVKAISYFGCEKIVGEGLARLLSSRLAGALLGARVAAWAEAAAASASPCSGAGPDAPLRAADGVPGAEGSAALAGINHRVVGPNQLQLSQIEQDAALEMGLRLVVKNSFIELVPDSVAPPPGFRRTQSCDPAFLRAHAQSLSPPPPPLLVPPTVLGLAPAARTAPAPEALAKTTLMLRNLPLDFSREMLLEEIDALGLCGVYNFVYLPIDFTRRRGLGYALISADGQEAAELMLDRLSGHLPAYAAAAATSAAAANSVLRPVAGSPGDDRWDSGRFEMGVSVVSEGPEDALWQASWSEPCRSLEEHIDRYRNSPVMHPSMPDEYKPAVFEGGRRVPFPPPTRPIRPPRIRHLKVADEQQIEGRPARCAEL